jgi:GDP-4-dehydro-6-deoxy-D-mannose reductase
MAPVLITGAGGFVGSHLIELLEQDDAEIVAWLRPGTEALVRGRRVRWLNVELLDRAAVAAAITDVRPTAIYHLAGLPHVGDSWGQTHNTFAGNVLATHHLFEALRHAVLRPRVLITSTAFVYAPSPRALTENDLVRPNSPYGTSKLAQEMLSVRAWQDDGLPTLIARSFNHVGPRQAPSFVAPRIAKQVAEIEAGRAEPLMAMGNLAPQRDFMHVRDTVRAYRAMMRAATPGRPYNVCSGTPVRIQDLVDLFISRARVPITVRHDPARFRPNDTPVVLGDPSSLQKDTGWRPEVPLAQIVEDLLDYWRRQASDRDTSRPPVGP